MSAVERKLPGLDVCPECGSPRLAMMRIHRTGGPDVVMAGCAVGGCGAIWEPVDPGILAAESDCTAPFTRPCDDCAFRPDSPERRDRAEWEALMRKFETGTRFYCHKGVPTEAVSADSDEGTRYRFPRREDGQYDQSRMRFCAGWLAWWLATRKREIEAKRTDAGE